MTCAWCGAPAVETVLVERRGSRPSVTAPACPECAERVRTPLTTGPEALPEAPGNQVTINDLLPDWEERRVPRRPRGRS